MRKQRIVNAVLAGALLFGAAACDPEDQRDAEEVGNEIEKGAEEAVNDAEKELDQLDKDGKDD